MRNTGLDADGKPTVQLVYGTTKLKFQQRDLDFFVTKQAEMDACGLYKATRFDLDEVHWIPWAEEWFERPQSYTSPIIGKLTDSGIYLLQITMELRKRRLAEAQAAKRQAARNRAASAKAKKASSPKAPKSES